MDPVDTDDGRRLFPILQHVIAMEPEEEGLAYSSGSDQNPLFQKRSRLPYNELCTHLPEPCFKGCLRKTLEVLVDLLASYEAMMMWHHPEEQQQQPIKEAPSISRDAAANGVPLGAGGGLSQQDTEAREGQGLGAKDPHHAHHERRRRHDEDPLRSAGGASSLPLPHAQPGNRSLPQEGEWGGKELQRDGGSAAETGPDEGHERQGPPLQNGFAANPLKGPRDEEGGVGLASRLDQSWGDARREGEGQEAPGRGKGQGEAASPSGRREVREGAAAQAGEAHARLEQTDIGRSAARDHDCSAPPQGAAAQNETLFTSSQQQMQDRRAGVGENGYQGHRGVANSEDEGKGGVQQPEDGRATTAAGDSLPFPSSPLPSSASAAEALRGGARMADAAEQAGEDAASSELMLAALRAATAADVRKALERGRKTVWELASRRVAALLSVDALVATSSHHFFQCLEWTHVFIRAGEAFSGAEALGLRARLTRQSEKYFKGFHRQNLEARHPPTTTYRGMHALRACSQFGDAGSMQHSEHCNLGLSPRSAAGQSHAMPGGPCPLERGEMLDQLPAAMSGFETRSVARGAWSSSSTTLPLIGLISEPGLASWSQGEKGLPCCKLGGIEDGERGL
eukprot:TRINITY_DN218_c0_g1_i25.p1 TRINITY_DN218_c0_g1~~TRINITY_DN218_c0_g1_i25.p1  ORF type:complete len:625 (+),score=150.78 TRINITY_DN218_c0_g1_i25:1333-3207(+)